MRRHDVPRPSGVTRIDGESQKLLWNTPLPTESPPAIRFKVAFSLRLILLTALFVSWASVLGFAQQFPGAELPRAPHAEFPPVNGVPSREQLGRNSASPQLQQNQFSAPAPISRQQQRFVQPGRNPPQAQPWQDTGNRSTAEGRANALLGQTHGPPVSLGPSAQMRSSSIGAPLAGFSPSNGIDMQPIAPPTLQADSDRSNSNFQSPRYQPPRANQAGDYSPILAAMPGAILPRHGSPSLSISSSTQRTPYDVPFNPRQPPNAGLSSSTIDPLVGMSRIPLRANQGFRQNNSPPSYRSNPGRAQTGQHPGSANPLVQIPNELNNHLGIVQPIQRPIDPRLAQNSPNVPTIDTRRPDLPLPAPLNDPMRLLQTPLTTPLPAPGPPPVVELDGVIEPFGPEIRLPIPQLDPDLPNWGNRDGEFELYDLIEEYAGRKTRGDLPDHPHLSPPDERSWLRIEDWRTEVSWIVANAQELGIGSASASVGIGLPKIKGLVIRPVAAAYWLNGPAQTDLPSRVYDAEVHATWTHRFNDRFRAHVNVVGGLYSDFGKTSLNGAFRLSGSAIGAMELTPDLQLVAGASYLNLGSIRLWPIGGLVWSPNDIVRFELIYPEGRITVKTDENETFVEKHYVALGFWGRTWEVERVSGLREKVTYSDWRVTTGYERRYLWGITTFFEFGLAFNRDLEYRSGNGTYQPSSELFARGGLFF